MSRTNGTSQLLERIARLEQNLLDLVSPSAPERVVYLRSAQQPTPVGFVLPVSSEDVAIFFRVRSFSWIMYSATPKSRNMLARPENTAATASTPISSGVSRRAMMAVPARRRIRLR